MKIYLFLSDKLLAYKLPKEISGSYSFDPNLDEESKLINIESREGKWVIYSTKSVSIIQNNINVGGIQLESGKFYILNRNKINYLVYAVNYNDVDTLLCKYDDNFNLVVGNTNNSKIKYDFGINQDIEIKFFKKDGMIFLEKVLGNVYVNNNFIDKNVCLKYGDSINIYGFSMMFLKNMFLVTYISNKLIIVPESVGFSKYILPTDENPQDIDIKDRELYSKEQYFSKSPRLRRTLEETILKISNPPNTEVDNEMPMILTIGPMLTMGVSSFVMVIDVFFKIGSNQTTFKNSWTTIATSFTMLTSMLLWPLIMKNYGKKIAERKRKNDKEKYLNYLLGKEKELENIKLIQENIIKETLISVQDCFNIIKSRDLRLWNKNINQDDLLNVRLGIGNVDLKINFDYSKEEFTLEDNELALKIDQMLNKYSKLENVPIGYSFYENNLSAIINTNATKVVNFVNNIILQLITFYSYEDLKLVVFTNEKNKERWSYIKYLKHNLAVNGEIERLFSYTINSHKKLLGFLDLEINNRISKDDSSSEKEEEKFFNKSGPYYFIIIDDYEQIKNNDIIERIAKDKNLGFSILIIGDRLRNLPNQCNNFITIGDVNSGILKNSFDGQEQITFKDEINSSIDMLEVARILSNIPIAVDSEIHSLPNAISFLELEKVGKVEQLNIVNRWKNNDSTVSLRAEVGVNDTKDLIYLDLHEKFHGPHGLIAGTTGSGKSEFIITYILSMCINYSPNDVSFIIIDYKGGGLALAFENRTTGVVLPHLAGTITNLDVAEMNRTLVSIDSEIKRRQAMFNYARDILGESTMDIYKYQRLYHEGKLKDPISHLFIICDEFAELKTQQPEFMDNLISVARIGRSLGVHLILATQKPSGVVNDQIWSNTKFRVCLKVQDEGDSNEMLKKPDAAHLTQVGRFYLQVGYDEIYELGQSGYCGAKYYPSDTIIKNVDKDIKIIDDEENSIKVLEGEKNNKLVAQGEQIGSIMKSIIEIANQYNVYARRLWLNNVPEIILEENLEKKYNYKAVPFNVKAIIGEYDAPEKQIQGLVDYDFLEDGNTLIYSTDSIDCEMYIYSLLFSTSKWHGPNEINYYIIDYGSQSLRTFMGLPQIGGMVFEGEYEKFNNLVRLIREEIVKRKEILINYGGNYENYIKQKHDLPLICIIINDYDSLYEDIEMVYEIMPELTRDSLRYGIVFILTGKANNSFSSKVSQNFTNIVTYKLKDVSDYSYILNVKVKNSPKQNDGRGIINNEGAHEFQTANLVENRENLNVYISKFVDYENSIHKLKAKNIPEMPKKISYDVIKNSIINKNMIPIGITKHTLEIFNIDISKEKSVVISSNKIDNTKIFVNSLLIILKQLFDKNLIIIDAKKDLLLDKNIFSNYINDDLQNNLIKIKEILEKNKSNDNIINISILIYNLDKLLSSLDDTQILKDIFELVQKLENIRLFIVDDYQKLDSQKYESWFNCVVGRNGIWIGKGVTEQSFLKASAYTKEMQQSYKNDMGFYLSEGEETLLKYIDFSEN